MSQAGVLIVAVGADAYMAQACLAAASVKRHAPDIPVMAASDKPDHALLKAGYIDRIEAIEPTDAARYPLPFAGPLLDRVRFLARSPFERTLHVDADARLVAPRLAEMFGALDNIEIALAEAAPDASFDRQHYGRPIFNTGVMLWRRSEATARLLNAFAQRFETTLELSRDAAPAPPPMLTHVSDAQELKRLLCADQIALAELFRPDHNPLGVSYAVLGEHWNWRGGAGGRKPFEPIAINHHPDLRRGAERQLASLAFDALSSGDGRRSAQLYQWLVATLAPNLLAADAAALSLTLAGEATRELASAAAAAPNRPANAQSLLRIAAFHGTVLNQSERAAAILRALLARSGAGGRA